MKKRTLKLILISFVFCLFASSIFAQISSIVGIGVALNLDSTLGYRVAKITGFAPVGAAESSGLKLGDLILKVNDKSIIGLSMEDIISLVTGPEGSKVKLEVRQSGASKTFTIIRKKIQVSSTFYSPAINTEFCTALAKLINDASYGFVHVIDSSSFREGEGNFSGNVYSAKLKIPETKKVSILKNSWGTTAEILVGNYINIDQVNKEGEKMINKFKACYPDFYFTPESGEESIVIHIGKKHAAGFEEPIAKMYFTEEKKEYPYSLLLWIKDGELKKFQKISTAKSENEASRAINTIYDAAINDFAKLKTKEYVSGGTFNKFYKYDVSIEVPGAIRCYIDYGGAMTMEAKKYLSYFYLGNSREEAMEKYKSTASMLVSGFGSDFVFTLNKPEEFLTENLPKKPEAVMIFARKKKEYYEAVTLAALVSNIRPDGRYEVYLSFYKDNL